MFSALLPRGQERPGTAVRACGEAESRFVAAGTALLITLSRAVSNHLFQQQLTMNSWQIADLVENLWLQMKEQ